MLKDTTVIRFRQPDAVDDPLTELAREGARRILAQALIAEADALVALWKNLKLPDGRDRVARHGQRPHRAIQTGVGPVEIRRAKVRDRSDVGAEGKIRRFCRNGRGGRRVSTRCCLFSTCAGCRPATFRSARRPPGQGRAELVASRDLAADGGMAGRITMPGRNATSRRGDTYTCGRMGSYCRPGWNRPPNACSC
jgi:hypothetical protein